MDLGGIEPGIFLFQAQDLFDRGIGQYAGDAFVGTGFWQYEDYKAGKLSRERFVERKRAMDARRQEVSAAVSEAEAREIVEEAGQREYREAFRIREYLHLEGYDKRVMASLIESAKVMGEDRLEVVWKFGDVYEKILGEMQ